MQNQRGFTLIELLAVLAAIAIMATLLLPALGNLTNEARILVVESDIQHLVTALNRFYAHTGVWPADVNPDPPDGEADPDLMGGECAEGDLGRRVVGLPEVPRTTARERGEATAREPGDLYARLIRQGIGLLQATGLLEVPSPPAGAPEPTAGRDTSSMGLLCKGSLPPLAPPRAREQAAQRGAPGEGEFAPPVALSRAREFLAEGAVDVLCKGELPPAEASRLRGPLREDDVDLLCRGVLPPARWDLLREALAEGAVDLLCKGELPPAEARRLRRRLSDVDVDLLCKRVLPPLVGARMRSLIAFAADVSTPAPAANSHLMRWQGPYLRKEIKANPFGGSYILDNRQNLFDVVDAPLRIPDVSLRLTRLPRDVQERIDADLDDGDPSTGWIRRDLLTPTTLVVLVAAY